MGIAFDAFIVIRYDAIDANVITFDAIDATSITFDIIFHTVTFVAIFVPAEQLLTKLALRFGEKMGQN